MYSLSNVANHNFRSQNFYVYEYWAEGVCFYVGKGRCDRWKRHLYYRTNKKITKSNPHFYNKILKYVLNNISIHIKIVFTGTEAQTFKHEQKLILLYGKRHLSEGTLTNIQNGGEGGTSDGKTIDQFTKTGKYIRTYKNAKEAMLINNWKCYSSISDCCNHKRGTKSYKGFVWEFSGCVPLFAPNKLIYQWTIDSTFITTHESVSGAAKIMECDPSTIRDAVQGITRLAVGYLWIDNKSTPILRLNKKTKPVRWINNNITYQSITEASKATKHTVTNISRVCKGYRTDVGNDIFEYV